MIKSKTEIMESIKAKFAEDTDDSTLSFIEDVNDTLDDLASKASDSTDWQKKYEENDKAWREKYKERFFSAPIEEKTETIPAAEQDDAPKTFDDLFTKVN